MTHAQHGLLPAVGVHDSPSLPTPLDTIESVCGKGRDKTHAPDCGNQAAYATNPIHIRYPFHGKASQLHAIRTPM